MRKVGDAEAEGLAEKKDEEVDRHRKSSLRVIEYGWGLMSGNDDDSVVPLLGIGIS